MSVRGFICSVALALLALPSIASAQQNPVLENFRAYSAALEQGDLTAAEHAAEAALAASEARDGDGGRTAILALNVATVRLLQNRGADALAPAQRALSLAQANPESGVDPLMAQLILGRAELADGSTLEEEQRLAAAIAQAQTQESLQAEAYSAAKDISEAAFGAERYEAAANYWRVAGDLAGDAPIDADLALANAKVWEGASVLMAATTHPRRRLTFGAARRALRPLIEAGRLALTHPSMSDSDVAVAPAQRVYAYSIAWRNNITMRIGSPATRRLEREVVETLPPFSGVLDEEERARRCPLRFETGEMPAYPQEQLEDLEVAVVVIRVRIDEQARIQGARVAAAVGSKEFAERVAANAPNWSVIRLEGAADCEMSRVLYVPFNFSLPIYR